MSETNSVSPSDAMMTYTDTPDAKQARQEMTQNTRQRLTLDPSKRAFTSRGVIRIEWSHDDGETWESIDLPLKSLSAKKNQEILDAYRVDLEDSHIPRVQNEKGQWVLDTESIEYTQYAMAFLSQMTNAQYEKVLYAYDGDLMSVDGDRLVWSSIDPKVCDVDAAMQALYALDIPTAKLSEITAKIDSLSTRAVVEDNQQAEGEPQPPSVSPETSGQNGPRARRAGQRRDATR